MCCTFKKRKNSRTQNSILATMTIAPQYLQIAQYYSNRNLLIRSIRNHMNILETRHYATSGAKRIYVMSNLFKTGLVNYNYIHHIKHSEEDTCFKDLFPAKVKDAIQFMKRELNNNNNRFNEATIATFEKIKNLLNRRVENHETRAAIKIQRLWRAHMYNPDRCAAGMELARRDFEACVKIMQK